MSTQEIAPLLGLLSSMSSDDQSSSITGSLDYSLLIFRCVFIADRSHIMKAILSQTVFLFAISGHRVYPTRRTGGVCLMSPWDCSADV